MMTVRRAPSGPEIGRAACPPQQVRSNSASTNAGPPVVRTQLPGRRAPGNPDRSPGPSAQEHPTLPFSDFRSARGFDLADEVLGAVMTAHVTASSPNNCRAARARVLGGDMRCVGPVARRSHGVSRRSCSNLSPFGASVKFIVLGRVSVRPRGCVGLSCGCIERSDQVGPIKRLPIGEA